MKIKLHFEGDAIRRMQDDEIRKQAKFALAKTLTGAAFEARKAAQKHLNRRLELKTQFLPKSVVVNKATKIRLYSEVGFLDRAWLVPLLEEGGIRRPRGRTIAVPQDVKRGKRGNITKAKRPRQILDKPNVFIADINGTLGIWERAKKGRRLKLLYVLEYTARYRPRTITFIDVAMKSGNQFIKKNLGPNLMEALRQSRKRRR